MLPEVAIRLIAPAIDNTLSAQTWADLGCGSGTFTRALASVLPPSSHIHALEISKSNPCRSSSGMQPLLFARLISGRNLYC